MLSRQRVWSHAVLTSALSIVVAEVVSILATVFVVDSLHAYRSRRSNLRLSLRALQRLKQEVELQPRLVDHAERKYPAARLTDIDTAHQWMNTIALLRKRIDHAEPYFTNPMLETRSDVIETLSQLGHDLEVEITKLSMLGWWQVWIMLKNAPTAESHVQAGKLRSLRKWSLDLDTSVAADYSFREVDQDLGNIEFSYQLHRVVDVYDRTLETIHQATGERISFWSVMWEDNILREMVRR